MRIECLTKFRDGTETFEAGDIRNVEDARAAAFIAHGWAVQPDRPAPAPASPAEVTLEVHNSNIGLSDTNG